MCPVKRDFASATFPPMYMVGYSPFSRFDPSISGCHPETNEIMNTSICRSSGSSSLAVDL